MNVVRKKERKNTNTKRCLWKQQKKKKQNFRGGIRHEGDKQNKVIVNVAIQQAPKSKERNNWGGRNFLTGQLAIKKVKCLYAILVHASKRTSSFIIPSLTQLERQREY